MADIYAVMQFKSIAETRRPSCEDVKRLLQITPPEQKAEAERYFQSACGIEEEISESTTIMIYGDGVCELWRWPNGDYEIRKISVVERFT
jgi:hypothetical protein